MSLPPPADDSVKLVSGIVRERASGKNRKYFKSIESEWLQRVHDYVQHRGDPQVVMQWPGIGKKAAFLNLYLHPKDSSIQGKMLAKLRDHDLLLCPACGEAGRPNTLDHYLPKGLYPHFCVTPLNLFPMCDTCQLKKGEKVGDGTSPRFFIHPYFDTFVGNQVLDLDIRPPFNGPSFSLIPAAGLTKAEGALLSTHVRELEIDARYKRYLRSDYMRVLRIASSARARSLDVVKSLSIFKESALMRSANAWEHVLFSSVLANTALVAYLSNGKLPDYL